MISWSRRKIKMEWKSKLVLSALSKMACAKTGVGSTMIFVGFTRNFQTSSSTKMSVRSCFWDYIKQFSDIKVDHPMEVVRGQQHSVFTGPRIDHTKKSIYGRYLFSPGLSAEPGDVYIIQARLFDKINRNVIIENILRIKRSKRHQISKQLKKVLASHFGTTH